MHRTTLALATLVAASIPLQASAKVIEHTRSAQHSAFATWQYTEGTVLTIVSVSVFTASNQTGGPQTQESLAVVSYFRGDLETNDILFSGTAQIEPDQFSFTIDGSATPGKSSPLRAARFVAQDVAFLDDNDFPFVTDVDITWSASGPVEEVRDRDKTKTEDGFILKFRVTGKGAPAVASGSAVVEGLGNFTPIATTEALISYADSASLVIRTGPDAD
jgi:hypothetical protein